MTMLIKANIGDGAWRIFEPAHDVKYLGPHMLVHVTMHTDDDGNDYDSGNYSADSRFPAVAEQCIHVVYTHGVLADAHHPDGPYRLVRWVTWRDDSDDHHMLVTDGTVFVCNAAGDTIEALR